jgi:NurA-like 5'-3' nuclease
MENFNKLMDEILTESKKPVKEFEKFLEARKSGADKIRKTAEAKGGAAKLTAIHFAAKEKPYSQALRTLEKPDFEKTLKSKANALASRIQQWHKMTQREFQDLVGQFEAYGEVYLEHKKKGSHI